MSSVNISETLSTLRFGTRAKKLRNKPRVNAERSISEYKKLLKASDLKVGELLAMIQELQAEIQSLKENMKNLHVAGSARNVASSRNQQPSPAPDVEPDESDDDEGISWIPNNDEDLKMDSEEIERLNEKVSALEVQLHYQRTMSEEEAKKKAEDEKRKVEDEKR